MISGSNSKVNKRQSEIILLSIKGLAELGFSLQKALDTMFEVEDDKKVKKILKQISIKITKENVEPAFALEQYGIINNIEKFMMMNSTELTNTIDKILDLRKMSNKFEKTMFGIFTLPTLIILASFIAAVLGQAKIIAGFEFVGTLVEAQTGMQPEIEMEWWIKEENIGYVKYAGIGFLTFIFSFIFFYYYKYKNDISSLYKLFKTKAYDDVPLIFSLINSLHESGLDAKKIMEIMHSNTKNRGHKKLYYQLKIEIEENKEGGLYGIFKRFNLPLDILSLIKTSESSHALWDSLPKIIIYAEFKNKTQNDLLKTALKFPAQIISYGFLMYALIGIILAGITIMSIMTSLMG